MALPHCRDFVAPFRRWSHHRIPEICSANARGPSRIGRHEQCSSPTGCCLYLRRFLSRIRTLRHGLFLVCCVCGLAFRRIGPQTPNRRRLAPLEFFSPAVSRLGTCWEILFPAAGGLFRPPRPLHRLGRVRYAIELFAKRLGIPQKPRPCPNLATILVGLPVEKSSPIN